MTSPRAEQNRRAATDAAAQPRALQQAVERECAAFEDVIGMLKREQDQLVAKTPNGLEAIVTAKDAGIAQIERIRSERLALMQRMGVPADGAQVEQFVARHPELNRVWLRLRAFVREAQRLNGLNGKLVSMRLQFVNSRLDALRQAAGIERLYDADGRSGGASNARRVIAAA